MYVCAYVISNQGTSEKPHYMSDLSKPDALLHNTHIKVLLVQRYQDSACVDPYNQRIKINGKNLKKWGRQYRAVFIN